MNPSIFKAYDIRGVYPEELNEEVAYKLGRAFAAFTKAKTAVLGSDVRISSPALFKAFAFGVTDSGTNAVNIGECSTPMFNFAVAAYKEHDAGAMITASHNPKQYNGVKMCYGDGLPIGGDTGMGAFRDLATSGKFTAASKKGQLSKKNILDAYLKKVLALADIKGLRRFKVAVCGGNGMAGVVLPRFFDRLDLEVTPLHWEPDGSFPNHEANPLKEENIQDLKEAVLQRGADLGFAFDGDADRIGVVDERGETVPGDLITAFLGVELLSGRPGGKILYDVRSSWAVPEAVSAAGGEPVMTRVGHAFIKKQLREVGAIFGGELSNHFYWGDFYGVECGELVLLKFLEIMGRARKPLSALLAPLRRYFHSGEINFTVADKEEALAALLARYQSKAEKIFKIDGLRVEFKDWWFSARLSNTEPLLRLNLEARSRALMEEKREEVSEFLKES